MTIAGMCIKGILDRNKREEKFLPKICLETSELQK